MPYQQLPALRLGEVLYYYYLSFYHCFYGGIKNGFLER